MAGRIWKYFNTPKLGIERGLGVIQTNHLEGQQCGTAKNPELSLATFSYSKNTVLLVSLSVRIFTIALKYDYTTQISGSAEARKVTGIFEKLRDQKTCFEAVVEL